MGNQGLRRQDRHCMAVVAASMKCEEEFDPSDGAIVYSTRERATHAHHQATQQLFTKWPKVQHYCCKES